MLIPVEFETAEDFIARAQAALTDPNTHVYIDTSMLMWLTAVGPSSRAVFLDWTTTLADRIHVPAWAAHEYYRHYQKRTQVNEIAEKCQAVDKALKDLKSHMRVYADGPLVPDKPEMSFASDLQAAAEHVESAMKVAQAWDYDTAAAEVIGWINLHALSTTGVFESFADLKRRGGARYGHGVPPGYEDAHKGVNRFGDLIFWEDVVADARAKAATKAVVLTRDRKQDWFFSGLQTEPGENLRRLKGKWDPVPVAHPMLTLEIRNTANAELILLDELYMGGVMWLTDKVRFGRLAAVTFGMDLARLEAATSEPPGIAKRAAKRDAVDTIGMSEGTSIVKAARENLDTDAVTQVLAGLQGQAPEVEATIEAFTAETITAMTATDLTVLAMRLFDDAHRGPSPAVALARRLMDGIDKVDALHASAIVGGMLYAAYFENGVARPAPVGQLLQELLEWRVDKGVERALAAVTRELKRVRSPALYRPSSSTEWIDVRIDASDSVATTPVAVGQVFVGPQGVLVDQPVEPGLLLTNLLGGTEQATVAQLLTAIGLHHGIPLAILRVIDAEAEEARTILSTTGLDRFEPLRQPLRPEDVAPADATPASPDATDVETGASEGADGGAMAIPLEGGQAGDAPRDGEVGDADGIDDDDEDLIDEEDQ